MLITFSENIPVLIRYKLITTLNTESFDLQHHKFVIVI